MSVFERPLHYVDAVEDFAGAERLATALQWEFDTIHQHCFGPDCDPSLRWPGMIAAISILSEALDKVGLGPTIPVVEHIKTTLLATAHGLPLPVAPLVSGRRGRPKSATHSILSVEGATMAVIAGQFLPSADDSAELVAKEMTRAGMVGHSGTIGKSSVSDWLAMHSDPDAALKIPMERVAATAKTLTSATDAKRWVRVNCKAFANFLNRIGGSANLSG